MNPYTRVGSAIGTNEAASLSGRLSAWHDAMVAHERRLRAGNTSDQCDDECPHADAQVLWSEALATFGPRADELRFLRSHAIGPARCSTAGATMDGHSEAAERMTRTRATNPHSAPAAPSQALQRSCDS
jgi:hypothetical protein